MSYFSKQFQRFHDIAYFFNASVAVAPPKKPDLSDLRHVLAGQDCQIFESVRGERYLILNEATGSHIFAGKQKYISNTRSEFYCHDSQFLEADSFFALRIILNQNAVYVVKEKMASLLLNEKIWEHEEEACLYEDLTQYMGMAR